MGGNALKEFGARRFSREEYNPLSIEVLEKLAPLKAQEIPYYAYKESFGDMDVIIPDGEDVLAKAAVLLNADMAHCVRNSNVMSILYKELQVDVIALPEEDVDSALDYYAYNDLGNLLGRMFHKLGLKYGHRGLTMPLNDGTHQFAEVMISKDTYSIYRLIGLNAGRRLWFTKLEDIFNFVVSCSCFCSDIFQFENLNSINRIRDRKRATYREFINWLETTKTPEGLTLMEHYSKDKAGFNFDSDKSVYLPYIWSHFPDAKADYETCWEQHRRNLCIKDKFNGNIVASITGLEGKELGGFMTYFREIVAEDWLYKASSGEIESKITDLFENYGD